MPIKVMRIIARLNIGGPAIHVTLLTERLHPHEFESILVCGKIDPSEGDMGYLAEAKGIEPIIIPTLGRNISLLRDFGTIWQLYKLMRQYRPDIVHTHTAKAGFVGRIAAWLARVPVRLHTFHGHVFHGYFGKNKTLVFLWLERLCARLSTRIITISPRLKDELVNVYHIAPSDKVLVLSLGLELENLANSTTETNFRTQFGLSPNYKLVGIIGRVVPIKNHILFLRAAEVILRKQQNIHFVIVGDGELRDQMEALTGSLNIKDSVTFTGWINDLRPIFKALDVMVITSNNEGTPVSVIEAMAAKVPVVATAVGGIPDLLNHGKFGTLVPPGEVESLATAILNTLDGNHPDLETACQYALMNFGIDRLVDDLAQLYREEISR